MAALRGATVKGATFIGAPTLTGATVIGAPALTAATDKGRAAAAWINGALRPE